MFLIWGFIFPEIQIQVSFLTLQRVQHLSLFLTFKLVHALKLLLEINVFVFMQIKQPSSSL